VGTGSDSEWTGGGIPITTFRIVVSHSIPIAQSSQGPTDVQSKSRGSLFRARSRFPISFQLNDQKEIAQWVTVLLKNNVPSAVVYIKVVTLFRNCFLNQLEAWNTKNKRLNAMRSSEKSLVAKAVPLLRQDSTSRHTNRAQLREVGRHCALTLGLHLLLFKQNLTKYSSTVKKDVRC
jgi:hypothetical protein